jgi:hypothetical protein
MRARRLIYAALHSTRGDSFLLVRLLRQAARDLNVFLGVPIGSDELAAMRRKARDRLRESRLTQGDPLRS